MPFQKVKEFITIWVSNSWFISSTRESLFFRELAKQVIVAQYSSEIQMGNDSPHYLGSKICANLIFYLLEKLLTLENNTQSNELSSILISSRLT